MIPRGEKVDLMEWGTMMNIRDQINKYRSFPPKYKIGCAKKEFMIMEK
jgi:hypothetical protein